MTKPMVRIHNAETDEIIDREMSDAEFADYVALRQKLESETAEDEAKREAALTKLAALGLTADDLRALGL